MRRGIAGLFVLWGILFLATCSQEGRVVIPQSAPTPDIAATLTAVSVPVAMTTATIVPNGITATPAHAGSLAAYANCVVCHDVHPETVVAMPHPQNPTCNECHSGSPVKIGCPSCHNMHRIEAPHASDADLACATCHASMP